MDGPAFHIAAALIMNAKRRGLSYAFSFGAHRETIGEVLTTLANLHRVITGDWSPRQREVVQLYERLGAQGPVSERLGITQQAVSSALRAAHWRDIHALESHIDHLLANLGRYNL